MTEGDLLFALPKNPGALFLALWVRAEKWDSTVRSDEVIPAESFNDVVQNALSKDDDQRAYAALLRQVFPEPAFSLKSVGRCLFVMRCIDDFFLKIHPRSIIPSPALSGKSTIPMWLEALREQRLDAGHYMEAHGLRLVPRGPLLQSQRDELANSAESLADRFAALSVVPATLVHEGRPIAVSQRVIWREHGEGVPAGNHPGREILAGIPIAEADADLSITSKHRLARGFVDYRLHADLNGAQRLIQALEQCGKVDIAVAPELIMTEDHADEIPYRLDASGAVDCRLIVAGSGQTRATANGRAWNEAQILNGPGAVLWRQRKIWPASIDHRRAKAYGIADFGPSPDLVEDTASGDRIEIIDVDSLGRCVVLICQDLMTPQLAPDVIRHFQPDWVFVPILDVGVDAGRWMHAKAFELSALSPARFVVVTSSALAEKVQKAKEAEQTKGAGKAGCQEALSHGPPRKESPAITLAVGQRTGATSGQGRYAQLFKALPNAAPAHVTFQWPASALMRSTLTITDSES
jgi:hypothetical protein